MKVPLTVNASLLSLHTKPPEASRSVKDVKSTSCGAPRHQTYVWDEMKKGVAAQRADSQRHQEAEEELEKNSAHERNEDDAQQRQQADDGDGDEAAEPRCGSRVRDAADRLFTRLTGTNKTSLSPIVMFLPPSPECSL